MHRNPTHLLSLSILALAGAMLFWSVQPAQAAGAMATNCQNIQAVGAAICAW